MHACPSPLRHTSHARDVRDRLTTLYTPPYRIDSMWHQPSTAQYRTPFNAGLLFRFWRLRPHAPRSATLHARCHPSPARAPGFNTAPGRCSFVAARISVYVPYWYSYILRQERFSWAADGTISANTYMWGRGGGGREPRGGGALSRDLDRFSKSLRTDDPPRLCSPMSTAASDLCCAFMLRHGGVAHLAQAAIDGVAWARRFFSEAYFLEMVAQERNLAAFDYLQVFIPPDCESGTAAGPSAWWQLAYVLADRAFRCAMARDDVRTALDAWKRLAQIHPGTRTHRRVVTLDKVLKGESALSELPAAPVHELPALLRDALEELPLLGSAHSRAAACAKDVAEVASKSITELMMEAPTEDPQDPLEMVLRELARSMTRSESAGAAVLRGRAGGDVAESPGPGSGDHLDPYGRVDTEQRVVGAVAATAQIEEEVKRLRSRDGEAAQAGVRPAHPVPLHPIPS